MNIDRIQAEAILQGLKNSLRPVYTHATVITPGTPVVAGHGVFINCTTDGNVTLILSSGDKLAVPVQQGANVFDNLGVVDVDAANTTATCMVSVLS